ncbi:DNA polymerase I [Kocuria sp. HSID16901]|uniref:DNA polymerase I n=1 Tax=Kocuria sp. HSID16901 TaxID=2419505 RepID=UPI000F87D015|nr:DNA polymerase I [Kocuria sp. HSID16901]RUQ22696.1 DNA polymerase I [Kocuria sp. HSID16901]
MTSASSSTPSSQNGKQRLLLIDGHSMAFRAFFALPAENFSTSTGQCTNAVYGFVAMLINLIKGQQPTHVAVAFDLSGPTVRSEEYSEYKAGRDETPQEFIGQVELIQQVMDAMNIHSVTVEGFEADDVIATMSVLGAEAGMEVLVVSGDRDAFQLVNDHVTVLYPRQGVTKDLPRMDAAAIEEKYAVPPEKYPDLAALTGEKADNLPGVPGVGPGFAAKWIAKYGDLEEILSHADEIPGKKGEALRAHIDDVRRNRRLNRLVTDVALPITVEQTEEPRPDRERINELFDKLEFNSLRDRLFALYGEDAAEQTVVESTIEEVQEPATSKEVTAWLDRAAGDASAAGDSESARAATAITLRPHYGNGETGRAHEKDIVGVTLVSGPHAAWFPWAELAEDAHSALTSWLEDEEKPKIVFNAKDAYKSFAEIGVELRGVVDDPALSAYLCGFIPLQRRREHVFEDLVGQYLHSSLPEPAEDDAQGALFDTAVDSDYEAQLASLTEALSVRLDQELAEKNMTALSRELELPLTQVLGSMERRGVSVDAEALDGFINNFAGQAKQAQDSAWDAAGHEVNLGSPKQLQTVLFDELDMPKTRKIKSGYSTDVESLQNLLENAAPDSPGERFLTGLMRYRDQTKLKQTVEGLKKAIASDGRIHTTFQQAIASTGRLSSTEPNLQNIPIRTDEGRQIRGVFVVAPDEVNGTRYETLLTADYSQIEMRIMAHLSGDEGLIEAYRSGEDLHRFVGSQVFGVEPSEVTPEMRSKVKAMSYGLAYGLSSYGLSKQLRIGVDEARGLMSNYFKRFGAVRTYLREVVEQARRDGYTETMLGRRRYLPDLQSDNRQLREMAERAALNAPIQGSAADIIKKAMLGVERRLNEGNMRTRMLLQIHDELILEVAPGELEAAEGILRDEMGGAVELAVPLEVQMGHGRSWNDAAH